MNYWTPNKIKQKIRNQSKADGIKWGDKRIIRVVVEIPFL